MVFGKKNGVIEKEEKYLNVSTFELERVFQSYLMKNESINLGFKLDVDFIVFTDKRIILTDNSKNEAEHINLMSINLFSIIDVKIEVGEINEVTINYIDSIYLKETDPVYESYSFDFENKADSQKVYKLLQEISYENCLRINNIN